MQERTPGLPSGTGAPEAQNGEVVGRRTGEPGPADAPESPVQRSTNRISISLESGVSCNG